ncbi:reverse transcriptase domain-containing protein [Mesorhizobium sp. XAP10]|uniref:reverse transcriptase domain-containing protein n=1 Tax=unclassified Mesorhizobium TaxID=325217 RepID=UPI0023DF0170|nr:MULTISPECIES: reverse transcriptase domain-containing protein [unclassified Mesorhizobium]MDF3150885.1 reverse transcriptase domain-containing protein [Mesorhizobium sp. XAP10]MDF3243771.1 reverse transcriptase domain-containing protein [Mesorhizobium sp. XAP4]
MSSVARAFGKLIPIEIPQELADEATLLSHLGLSPKELKKIWWYRGRMYHQFPIAKGSGKVRLITAPDKRLKILQSKLALLLDQLYRVRNPVHGFVPERSVKTNAEAHGRRRFIVNLDLKDFFPTITENRVCGLLTSLGVNKRVAEIISRLCCFNSHLPQGAPTSPVLSNMICYRLDTELLRFAKDVRAIYTRYADDITFSSYQPPAPIFEGTIPAAGRFSPEVLAPQLRQHFQSNGFTINPDKCHYADRNSRRVVTGVKINAGLNVDRRYVRHIRALLHSVETLGMIDAQTKYSSAGGKGSIAIHLRGKISYIAHLKGQTDPVVRALARRYNKSFEQQSIKLAPTPEERRDRSVWIIEHSANGGEQGTAFFLKEIGLVTAAHCVEGVSDFTVYHPTKPANLAKVTVLKRCEHRDLAILGHAIHETEYYELEAASRAVVVGDIVTAYGYPGFGPGDKINVRTGPITSLPIKSAVQMIEVTQELTQGMSGGPILDVHGAVVGIVHKGGPNEGRQLAIHVDVLRTWV